MVQRTRIVLEAAAEGGRRLLQVRPATVAGGAPDRDWDPPENAVVISIAQWLRLPNGQAVRGHNHEYKRHGTTTLFAALEVHTGTVAVGHYRRRRRREFLDFMNRVVAQHPETELQY